MRTLALSFVVTVAASSITSCTNPPPPEPVHPNPPAQPNLPPGPLCTRDVENTPCETQNALCYLPDNPHGCGLNGFACREGKWQAVYTSCNPPATE